MEKYIYEIIHPETRDIKTKWFTLDELISWLHWYWKDFMNKGYISYREYLDNEKSNKVYQHTK